MTAATSHDRNFSLQGSTNETRTYWENLHLCWTCVEFFSWHYPLSNVVLWIVNNLDISKVFKVYRRCAGITYKCPGLGCRFCHLLHMIQYGYVSTHWMRCTGLWTCWRAEGRNHAVTQSLQQAAHTSIQCCGFWGSSNVIPSLQQLMTKTPNQN